MKKKYLLFLMILFMSIGSRCLFANENIKIYRPYDGIRVNLDKLNETGELLSHNWSSESDSATVVFNAPYDSVKIMLSWRRYRAGFNNFPYRIGNVIKEWNYSSISSGEELSVKWDNNIFMLPDSYFEGTSLYTFPERFHLYQDEDQDICAMIDSLRYTDFHKNYWENNGFKCPEIISDYFLKPSEYLEDPWNRGEIWGTLYHKNGKRLMAGEYEMAIFGWNKGNKNNLEVSGFDFFIERKDEDAAFKYYTGAQTEKDLRGLLGTYFEGYNAKLDSVVNKAYEEGLFDTLHPYPMTEEASDEYDKKLWKFYEKIIEDDSNDGSKNEIPHKNNKTTDKKM